jgi:hypothetical protein
MSVQAPGACLVMHQAALAAVQTWRQNQDETQEQHINDLLRKPRRL